MATTDTTQKQRYSIIIELLGGRKFFLTLLILFIVSLFCVWGTINAADFIYIIKWMMAIYVVGNVGHNGVSVLTSFLTTNNQNKP